MFAKFVGVLSDNTSVAATPAGGQGSKNGLGAPVGDEEGKDGEQNTGPGKGKDMGGGGSKRKLDEELAALIADAESKRRAYDEAVAAVAKAKARCENNGGA